MLTPLPIDPLLKTITDFVSENSQIILTATPGAGKTTRLPPELLNCVKGKIAILEPRRMATVSACERVALERGWSVGNEVGYQVRFDSQVQKNTRLIFMTDALLLRKLVDDPELNEFDLIVIDEFHERNLNQDVILGVLKELQDVGRNLKIMIMSATLDVDQLAAFLPEAQHIDVPGKIYPLEIRHQITPQKLITDFDFYNRVNDAVLVSAKETQGDILVFLPGQGEIHRLKNKLEETLTSHDVFSLHGSLSLQDQKNILKLHSRPRVILSTNIAEASVTVPGVDRVIDTGLAKVMQVHPQSGFSRLELTRISQFNAQQRAGRAARQKPGVCIRLWTTHEEVTQAEALVPECQRVDLSATLLLLSNMGIRDFSNFSWLDKPPQSLIAMATLFLKNQGAIDSHNRITSVGKNFLRYPLPPRWSALLSLAEKMGGRQWAARTAAMLNEKDFIPSSSDIYSHLECDMTYRLQLLDEIAKNKRPNGVSLRAADMILESAQQLERLIPSTLKNENDPEHLKKLLLLSQSDRLCRRRKGTDRAIMVGGRGIRLAKESQVRESEFFVCLNGIDFPGKPDTTISLASGFSKQFVLTTLADQIQTREDITFDEDKGQFFTRRVRCFYDLELDDPSLSRIESKDLGNRFTDVVIAKWNYFAEKNQSLKKWLHQWNFLITHQPEMAQHFTSDHQKQASEIAAFGKTQMSQVLDQDWVGIIESLLDKTILRQFHKEVPSQFKAPSGHSHSIHYEETEGPFVEIRLQEVFGLTSTPKLVFGKVPLTFKLLGPNYRPVQVTSDIEGFWQRGYIEVRKELRGRYPKHSWPEDPLTAVPVAKGQRRK